MRAFAVSLLLVSLIASSANAGVKKVDKRGILTGAHHGGIGEVIADGGKYLPPVHPIPIAHKTLAISAPTYSVPLSVPTYTAVAHAPVVAPIAHAPVASIAHAPALTAHVAVPHHTYGLSSYAYGAPSVHLPVHHPVPVSTLGVESLSTSYVPSVGIGHVPAADVSFAPVSYQTHGAVASAGLSLGHVSLPTKTYGVPVAHSGHGVDLSLGAATLPATSYGVPATGVHLGHGDGYSYPVPSKKLIV